ncbi:MAG: DUF1684 domain-containing protein [Anaerolineae bacterium]|nr:DUF1684 domain-containing protein [Anaerolineae bacterium]
MDANELELTRFQKNDFFKNHPQSPLSHEQRQQFEHLSYYPLNEDLELQVQVEVFAEQKTVPIQTTTGTTQYFKRYGQFTFTVDGQAARLTIYEADYGFFLPFVDAGAGAETYGAGRYLEPERLGDNHFYVDFNQAYNPYCAYGPDWVCPVTPAENRLSVHIRAGEKLPEGKWVIKA